MGKVRSAFFLVLTALLAGCLAGPPAKSAPPVPAASTVVATPSHAPTRTPTSIPATSTPTPSPIPATSSPTVTPSPTGFKPGDPTATPLGSDVTNPDFIAGVKADQADDYPDEIRLMTAVIQAEPDLAPAYRYRGVGYWGVHNCPAGLADEQKALGLNPDYAAAWADLALLLQACQGDPSQILSDYQQALSIDPSLAFAHDNIGVFDYAMGYYQEALEEFQAALAIDPGRASSWGGESESYGQMGQLGACLQTANTSLKLDPKYWYSYAHRGYCYFLENEFSEAVQDYKVYVDHEPQDGPSWYNYGLALKHSGDLPGAVSAYSRALAVDPSFYPANINRGNLYLQLEEYGLALNDFNTALQSSPEPLAYAGRGYVYYYRKQYDLAIEDFQTSVSLGPTGCGFNGLALSYFAVGQYSQALQAADSSNQADPTCGGSKLAEVQARSYYALGEYDQALTYINQAMGFGPYTLGYYYRGTIEQALGMKANATEDLQQFLQSAKVAKYTGPEIADAGARLKQLSP